MDRLYEIKDFAPELYFQIEITKSIGEFLNNLVAKLYGKRVFPEDFCEYAYEENSHLSYNKKRIYFVLTCANKRAHITIIGLKDNSRIKELLTDNYNFKK